ncbi:RNA polymerase sigma factor RpoE [Planctomycetes bacterium Poly30]|uniref:RNA polymerase sigma factor RpoE n=1 Tax=Saltatorellus ferox TaxID=2528018 RepID=A0A518F1B4_9BACT|nr:RNA polymerase sigma factor RpoE [Planctomycetes bacterium Poly30]
MLGDWVWLGQLASRIVADAGLADDAQQAAWVSASAPGAVHGSIENGNRRVQLYWALRRWISSTHRSDQRRVRRERVAARTEALPSTEELILRGEQQRRIWDALKELPEPLRGTLLLHFQDGLSVTEIAERSNAKADTVRRRIHRGVAILRDRLDADLGGGGVLALCAAIPGSRISSSSAAAWTAPPVLGITLTAGVLLMLKGLAALATVAVLVLAGREFMDAGVAHEVAPTAIAAESEDPTGPAAPDRLEAIEADVSLASKVRTEAPVSTETEMPAPTIATLTGQVVVHDIDGTVVTTTVTGTLEAALYFDRTGRGGITVHVQGGQFSLSLTRGADGAWLAPGQAAAPMSFTACQGPGKETHPWLGKAVPVELA